MSTHSLLSSTRDVLTSWRTDGTDEDSLRHTMLAFLESAPEACLRRNVPGHFTASSLVLDSTAENVLLTLHPRVGRWIQLGGHCEESDDTILGAALREAVEESGIENLSIDSELLSAHTHPITCSLGMPTRHLDLRFLVRAPVGAQIIRSAESTDLRWWPVDRLPATAAQDTIAALTAMALDRVRRR